MADYGKFKYGAVTYPIPTDGTGLGGAGATFLRDSDPALFYIIEFYKSIIETYIGPRLMQEAAAVGITSALQSAVAEWFPLDPEPYLLENQIRFPMLAVYRQTGKFEWLGRDKNIVDEMECVYVLPPMTAGEAERLMPVLHAVVRLLDNRTELGFDPNYTPSAPTGTPGEPFWQRAGLTSIGLKSFSYGSYMSDASLVFPAVKIVLEVKEKSASAPEGLETYTGVDVHEDLAHIREPTVTDFVVVQIDGPVSITSATPPTGTKQGGTTVTVKGSNFLRDGNIKVYFDNIAAQNVTVIDDTTLTCKTPPHDAYPTAMADIYIVDSDGGSQVLTTAFTYTTP